MHTYVLVASFLGLSLLGLLPPKAAAVDDALDEQHEGESPEHAADHQS
jgi:hypothetical protein